jgi:GntR family transcriptional repressor for pyruvate dehydrogenase complex
MISFYNTTNNVRPRTPPKASDILANDLRAYIVGNALVEGTQLPPEAELISRLRLSRATVREALRLLEAEGLITIRRGPRGGITVRHPDPEHVSRSLATMVALADAPLRELFAFRKVVEPAAAASAARLATEEQRKQLAALLDNPGTELSERVDFHVLIAEMSGNVLFHMILAALHDVLEWHVQREELTASDVDQTWLAHKKIAQAIIAGDEARAARAMGKHIEVFEARMEEAGRLDEPIIPSSSWGRQSSYSRAFA